MDITWPLSKETGKTENWSVIIAYKNKADDDIVRVYEYKQKSFEEALKFFSTRKDEEIEWFEIDGQTMFMVGLLLNKETVLEFNPDNINISGTHLWIEMPELLKEIESEE